MNREHATRSFRSTARAGVILTLAAAALAIGCAPTLDTTYGRRRGRGMQSMAGTAVLAGLLEQRAARVDSWSRISPKLYEYDVVFWFPDDFRPPDLKQRVALERWLAAGADRTLVYVGRDFDPLSYYWRTIAERSTGDAWLEARGRLALSRAAHETRRLRRTPSSAYARWFTLKAESRREVTQLRSSEGWADGVDASKLDLSVATRLQSPVKADLPPNPNTTPPPNDPAADAARHELLLERWRQQRDEERRDREIPLTQELLGSDAGPLVRRVVDARWGDSQILVVANGGFLLNLPLVNREHRMLAERLIDECGVAGRNVVFLESEPGGPPVYEEEPEDSAPSGLELFTVWPLGLVMLHLLGLGCLACFILFPHFGRAREPKSTDESDFGKHIDALGALLSHTQAESYVTRQLKNYHAHVKRDSGMAHADVDQPELPAAPVEPAAAEPPRPPRKP